jgi:FMN phosphatase YigB (HAD superfamily)
VKQLFCFDVFDTLLTRLVGDPVWVFFVLGQRLASRGLISISADEFRTKRVEAERRARLNNREGEVSVADIWMQLGRELDIGQEALVRCIQDELRIEEELIRPVPHATRRVRHARERGKVAFVSNMYLPAEFIERQLQKYELWIPGSRVYVSSELGCSKTTGALFRAVLRREATRARDAHHIGNDADADVRGAKAARLRATLDSSCALNRYERILQAAAPHTQGIGAFMAGASRLARLQATDRDIRSRTLWEVGAGVAAPALTAYLIWLFQRARELRIRRLYFVSRDGQILLEMARSLAPKWNLDLEFRYLYGSRQSWHVASLSAVTEKELKWIMTFTSFLSVETALARVCLEPEDAAPVLLNMGFGRRDWRRNLNLRERERLTQVFLDKRVSIKILDAARERRPGVVRYLRQEGLFDGIPSAIVDVGWTGKALDSLVSILESASGAPPYAFYFGLIGQASDSQSPRSPREGFYIDAHRGKGEPIILDHRATILEMFCAGDHGQVRSYADRADGIVAPVLKETSNILVLRWGLSELRQAVRTFVAEFSWPRLQLDDFDPLARMAGVVMREFWSSPTYEEARVWGSFPYFDDQTEAYWNTLAEPPTISDIFRIALGGGTGTHMHSWTAASRLLASMPIRAGLRAASSCGCHYRRLRRMVSVKFGIKTLRGKAS